MELKEFQLAAVKSLFEAMEKPARDIILKSPTGSGKTIILTYFMHQYIQSFPKTVFVWLTPRLLLLTLMMTKPISRLEIARNQSYLA